ncbi:hypothetical protein FGO68_gene1084 [Halteria grandinella]|uniref:Uncharacterized protein n=1 Tax=Halteria grandinella TaxID=5974 RepID=A0A8J8T495_HALGN|nr:hypothetical protein FGO68_gene1084 [Halteria grandinella]
MRSFFTLNRSKQSQLLVRCFSSDQQQQQQPDSSSYFVPNEELKFDEKGKLHIFQCHSDVNMLSKLCWFPLPIIAFFGYKVGASIFIAHSIVKTFGWSIPFVIFYRFRNNAVDNAASHQEPQKANTPRIRPVPASGGQCHKQAADRLLPHFGGGRA